MDLGAFVRRHRTALGLTQTQLAERAGVGLNFVYQLEKNKPTVQLDCTRLVLQALGFDLAVQPQDPLADTPAFLPTASPRALPWD